MRALLSFFLALGNACLGSDLASARHWASHPRLDCETAVECEPAVALLTGMQKDNGQDSSRITNYQCTAFLIDSQTVLTNRHCVPVHLREIPFASCRDWVWLTFPDSTGARTVACESVERISGRKELTGQDWAFLRLASVVRARPLTLSHAGLPDRSRVDVRALNPVPRFDTLVARPHELRAEVINGSPAARYSNGDVASPQVLLDAAIVGGNSGSPVLDAQGKVVGLVDGRYDSLAAMASILDHGLRLLDDRMVALGQVTNLACVPFAGEDSSVLPEACSQSRIHKTSDFGLDSLYLKLAANIALGRGLRGGVTFLDSSSGSSYRQMVRNVPAGLKLVPEIFVLEVPECLERREAFLAGTRNPWWMLWWGYRERFEEAQTTRVHMLLGGVDRKGRLGVRLHPTEFSLRSSWSWSPAQLVRTDSVELVQAFPTIPALQVRQVLKPCPKGAKL
jgi:Trypsin-like peptidase domain